MQTPVPELPDRRQLPPPPDLAGPVPASAEAVAAREDPGPRAPVGIWAVRPALAAMATLIVLTGDMVAPSAVTIAVAWSWILASTGLVRRRARGGDDTTPGFRMAVAVGDVTAILGAIAISGGVDSPIRWLILVAPPLLSYSRLPRMWPIIGYGALGFVVVSAADVASGGRSPAVDLLQVLGLYAGATFVAWNAAEVQLREARLRLRVLRAGVEHDEELLRRERESQEDVAVRLHDGPLQLVLAAAQDLEEHLEGDDIDLEQTATMLRASVTEMRDLSASMYDAVLRDEGLVTALNHAAEATMRNGGPAIRVAVGAQTAGPHDGVVVGVVDELLTNVRKHARARQATVLVSRVGDWVDVTVVDDGRGMEPDRAATAARHGHIGLSSIGRRAGAVGGSFSHLDVPVGSAFRLVVPAGAPSPG